jgi:ABC-type multidrug transport system ATPase subunit
MQINFNQASRTFGAQTVFKNLSQTFAPGSQTAVLGGNGSGKSTFLKTVYGALGLSQGTVQWQSGAGHNLSPFEAAKNMSYAGPYFELIEELTALEFLKFYQRFRPYRLGFTADVILERTLLTEAANKQISNFSSGMKQRLKIGLALFSASEVVILDEPTSNLDPKGMEWYQTLLKNELENRTLLVGSNFSDTETFLCEEKLELRKYQ